MLKDQEKEWQEYSSPRQPLRQSDGAFMAGIASGIGGAVPAAMFLAQTAQHNADVQKYNEAHSSGVVVAREYQKAQAVISEKLVSEEPKENLMKHLTFDQTNVIVTESGTVWVGTRVTFDGKLMIFEDVPAFIDGTVIVEIYDRKKDWRGNHGVSSAWKQEAH